jgi:hypothetical protein
LFRALFLEIWELLAALAVAAGAAFLARRLLHLRELVGEIMMLLLTPFGFRANAASSSSGMEI